MAGEATVLGNDGRGHRLGKVARDPGWVRPPRAGEDESGPQGWARPGLCDEHMSSAALPRPLLPHPDVEVEADQARRRAGEGR